MQKRLQSRTLVSLTDRVAPDQSAWLCSLDPLMALDKSEHEAVNNKEIHQLDNVFSTRSVEWRMCGFKQGLSKSFSMLLTQIAQMNETVYSILRALSKLNTHD